MANLVVHDFAGHPFQVELSRELARRGHIVHHVFGDEPGSPTGEMTRSPLDPGGFSVVPIPVAAGRGLSITSRIRADVDYRQAVRAVLEDLNPAAVISANTPLLSQHAIQRSCEDLGARSVYWYQDSYAVGMAAMAADRLGRMGRAVAAPVTALESNLLRRADAVVAIAPAFVELARRAGADPDKVAMIRNWAPLGAPGGAGATPAVAAPTVDAASSWKQRKGLEDRRVVLYSGTLGLKHNPSLVLGLADGLAELDDVAVVVVSQGAGRDWLEAEQARRRRPNLYLYDFEPAAQLPAMLTAADLTVVLLEAAAGSYSVPSKLLSYLATGRPVVASVPAANDAAAVLAAAGAGVCVEPGDDDGFVTAARGLMGAPDRLATLGQRARRYAEAHFDVRRIADRFEQLATGVVTEESAEIPPDLETRAGLVA